MRFLDKLFNGSGAVAVALRITIVYAVLGSLWIAFSDKLLITIFDPDTVSDYAMLQTYKGWFFILLTSVILLFLITGNIKKLKQSEELQLKTESRYRTIFENSGAAIAILDEDLTVSLVNVKFAELSGYRKSEIEGKRKWNDFIKKEDLTKMIGYLRDEYNNTDELPAAHDFKFITKEKNIRDVLVNIAHIPGTRQSIVSLNDISEKKELEIKYLRAQRMESIGTLSGGIAHDLNNILAPIILAIESLRTKAGDDKNKRILNIIESSAKRGTELVNQILTFSRGIHGEHIALHPRYAINEIVDIINATFPKSIKVVTDIPGDIRHIAGNATQIHQALMNICVNARDAMPDGGTLTIRAENIEITPENKSSYLDIEKGYYVVISISDTGTGIAGAVKDKLFDPFFTTKSEGKGTGLGLPTVEFIMRNHQGNIVVESEQGAGSTFKLYFPATEVRSEQEVITTEHMPMGNGQRLLVIDDEVAICEMISEILHTYNYEVIVSKDGTEGLATYKKYKETIDLVLTDSNMPLLGGEQLITALHKTNPNVKIFITTGSEEMQERLKHLQPPIVGFLQKPYSTYTLLNQLHEILT